MCRTFWRSPAMWAFAWLLGAPLVAEAQLFPNLPIHKRTRPDCSEEKPVFGMYRQHYYGYHPTCWRRFPPGWGCPSHDAPNWQASLAQQPLDDPPPPFDEDLFGPGADPFLRPGDPFAPDDFGREMPPLPPTRSPFELDQPEPRPFPPGAPAPDRGPGLFDPPRSPFDEPAVPRDREEIRSPFDLDSGAVEEIPDLPTIDPPVTAASDRSQTVLTLESLESPTFESLESPTFDGVVVDEFEVFDDPALIADQPERAFPILEADAIPVQPEQGWDNSRPSTESRPATLPTPPRRQGFLSRLFNGGAVRR